MLFVVVAKSAWTAASLRDDIVWQHLSIRQRVDGCCHHESGPAIACWGDLDDASTTSRVVGRVTTQLDSVEPGVVSWDSVWHPGNMSENRVAAFDNVLHDWRQASLVCYFNILDMILPSDANLLSIWCWHFMWKLSRIRASSAHRVHVSAAYRRVERTTALYVRILMGSDKRRSHHSILQGGHHRWSKGNASLDIW